MPDLQLPLFAKLGHGYDIVSCEARNALFEPVYDSKSTYGFRGGHYLVPEGVAVEPGPESVVISTAGMTIQKQIHDLQTSMGLSVGVKLDSFGEFSRSQKVELRQSAFSSMLRYFADVSGSFSFFRLRLKGAIDERLLEEQFVHDARACNDEAAFREFVQTYGTHVIAAGSVGGELQISMELNVEQMKQSLVAGTKLSAEVSAEIEEIPLHASSDFDARSERTDQSYRSCSSRKILKIGGDITAKTLDEWRASLKDSRLPEAHRLQAAPVTFDGPLRPMLVSQEPGTLAFSITRLLPISQLLEPVDKGVAAALDARIRKFVADNKIDNAGMRQFDPLVGGGGPLRLVSPGGSYHCGAWALATTGLKFGLKAAPGVRAEVRVWHPLCKEQTIALWAGDSHDVSGFYGAGNLWIYLDCDDPSARLKLHVW